MWTMLLLLWSIPLGLGLVALARVANGSELVSDDESQLLFGTAKKTQLSVWMAIKFVALAVVFFVVGMVEGAVLLNFGMAWIVLASLLTSTAAILLLALWIRTGPYTGAKLRQHGRWNRVLETFSRKLSRYRSYLDAWRTPGESKRQAANSLTRRYDGHDF